MRRSLVGLVLGASVAAVATLAPPAGAQPQPPPPTFGIRAGLAGQTSLPGDHFTYGLEPGSGIDDSVVLYNYTDAPLTLTVYAADVRTTSGGALAPAQATDAMREVGAWAHLESGQVTLPRRGEAVDRFHVGVPVGTVPGDYVGAIVASLAGAAVPDGLTLEARAARLIRLKVPGEAQLGVSVGKPRAVRSRGGEDFEVEVRNTGNVLVTVAGVIEIGDGKGMGHRPELVPRDIYIVPGGQATLRGRWDDPPTVGRRQVRAVIDATVPGLPPQAFRGPPVTLTFVPLVQGAVAGGLVVAVGTALRLTRTRRRQWLTRRRQERKVLSDVRARLRANERLPVGS